MRCVHLLLVALLLAPSGARAAAPKTAEEIRACVVANTPEVTHVQVVQLTATDRVGNERVTRAHVYGRRDENGLRRVLARFTEPPELVGSAFLFIEREDATELVVRSPELDSLKQVTAREMTGSVAGTDFTYEDFERLRVLNRPGELRRLDDAPIEGRNAWVLETKPVSLEGSAYQRIVHYVDPATCLPLRTEMFERGGKLRKVLSVAPGRFRELGSVWVFQEAVMRDLRDGTETRLMVESFDMDADIPAATFTVEALEQVGAGQPEKGPPPR